MCFRICRRSPDLVYSSKLDSLDKNIRELSSVVHQRKIDLEQSLRAIFSYSVLILAPLIATLYALDPQVVPNVYKLVAAVVSPLACYIFYHVVNWMYSRRLRREQALLEQMSKDMQETLEEYKEKTNFAEMIRKMAQYEQAARASSFMQPIGPPPKEVHLFTPPAQKGRGTQIASTPAVGKGGMATDTPKPPITPHAAVARRASGMGMANDATLATPAPHSADATNTADSMVPSTPAASNVQQLRAELQAARAEADALRQHAHASQAALWQNVQAMQSGAQGPLPHAAAQMVAGGLTADDVRHLNADRETAKNSTAPQARGLVDKVVDYVLGEGPNSRYALICQYCYAHNGLSLPDEFAKKLYRCCRCGGLNGNFDEILKQAPSACAATGKSESAGSDTASASLGAPRSARGSPSAAAESKKRQ